jgi:diguanylate cyclase (GGDEF)-like protein
VIPPGYVPFRTYGPEVGLESSAVTRVEQDSIGFIWAGTQDGLYRYDGQQFTRYGLDEGLPSTFIDAIVATKDGGLWVSTTRGIVRWDGSRFRVPTGLSLLRHLEPNAIAVDDHDTLWVAHGEGLFRYVPSKNLLVPVPAWTGEATAVSSERGTGRILAAGVGRVGIAAADGTWTFFDSGNGLGPERIDSVLADRSRRIWARSGAHLWSKAEDEADFRDESAHLPSTSDSGYLDLDRKGNLWVSTDRGVAMFDGTSWRVVGVHEGLPTEWARDVMEDREGSIWIVSLALHRMLGHGAFTSYTRMTGLPSDVTWCIRADHAGRLLVGTDKGVARTTPTGWEVVPGTGAHKLRSLIETGDGSLWAAGIPAEVLRVERSGRIRRYGVEEGISGKSVLKILFDRNGTLWAATNGGGLRFKREGSERFERAEIPNGTKSELFGSLAEDRSGRLWAAGDAGLACLSGGIWQRFTTADGLSRDHVSYVLETAAGDLWVAYFEPLGIVRVAASGPAGAVKIRISERVDDRGGNVGEAGDVGHRKLASGKVFLLGEDHERRLWVGTGKGVDVIGPRGVRHFGVGEGLVAEDTDAMAFLCDTNGDVYVGTSAGVSRYVPPGEDRTAEPPPPIILSARIGPRPLPLGPSATSLEFPHDQRDFHVSFAALSYLNESLVEFQVRLVGADGEWKPAPARMITYTALPPARYRFDLRARMRGGEWSLSRSVSFGIRPALWQTTAARILGVGLLAGLVAGAFRWRGAVLRSRNRELEKLVEERTRELARANENLVALSVTDSLTGLNNRRFLHRCIPEYLADSLRRYDTLERAGSSLARCNGDLIFLMIDLDHFKQINDEHGHLAGDHVLADIGSVVKGVMRESDLVVRWGGEEFLFVARNTSREDAHLIAERIRTAIGKYTLVLADGTRLRIACSVGFAPFPFFTRQRSLVKWEEVIDFADAALYAAKGAGRNRWVGLVPGQEDDRLAMLERLRADAHGAITSGAVRTVSRRDQPPGT